MLRPVEIDNTSSFDIVLAASGDYPSVTIPAHGKMYIPSANYIAYALSNDLSALSINVSTVDVDFRNVSVKDFGAVGDGAHNDTYSIQAAIDSVAFYGGGIVRVPVGVYLIDGVVLSGDVSLAGDSYNGSILKLTSTATKPLIAVADGSSSITDILLRGND